MSEVAFRPFESIAAGDTASLVRTISAEDVRRFAELTGDVNPLHVDPAYAETTPFKDVVVHGMLGASYLSTLIGTRLPGEGALWVSQSFDFLRPVRIGDTLTVTCVVTSRHERERLLGLDARIENQWHEAVLTGKGTVRVLPRPPAEPAEAPARPLVAVVAGAAGGIGRAICRRLAADGFAVVAGYHRHPERAAALVAEIEADGGRALAVRADIADPAEAESLVAAATGRFGGLGVVVHAVSPPLHAVAFGDLAWTDVAAHLDADVRGAFNLARAGVPIMTAQGHGRLVVITSQVLDGAPPPRWTGYTVAKAALAALARSLAVELGPAGITVNCVAPGMTDTALIGDLPEKQRLLIARAAPLRRLASPEDVAGAVAFLVSPAADYITGETIRVNGGQVML
jgi:3-oxoacyl-[acyl-carrier protein] reductase